MSIRNIFWPMTLVPGKAFTGYLDSVLMTLFIIGVILVVFDAARRCWKTLHGEPVPEEAFGPPELKEGTPPARCC